MSELKIQELTTPEAVEAIGAEWEALRALQPGWLMSISPETLLFEARLEDSLGFRAVTLYRDQQLVGVAPLIVRRQALEYRLGHHALGLPLRTAELLGGGLLTADASLDQPLFDAVLRSCRKEHVIRLRTVPLESSLTQLMCGAPRARHLAWFHDDTGPQWRRMIQLSGSMDDYLQKFSGKTRRTLRYQVTKLEKAAPGVQLHCLRRPEEVSRCFDWVQRVSAKSWQAEELELGRGADRIDRMRFWAERGWLRAYFLVADGAPLAFVLGRQENGLMHLAQTGFDRDWFELKAGTVLLYKMFEDLHVNDPPHWFDFGTQDMEYKQRYANHSHQEARWLIFPKSVASGLTLGSYASYQWAWKLVRKHVSGDGGLKEARGYTAIKHAASSSLAWLRRSSGRRSRAAAWESPPVSSRSFRPKEK